MTRRILGTMYFDMPPGGDYKRRDGIWPDGRSVFMRVGQSGRTSGRGDWPLLWFALVIENFDLGC